jgi:hypothetical protein
MVNMILIISGSNWEHPGDYVKVSEISESELDEIRPIIEAIKKNEGPCNWSWCTELVKDSNIWKSKPIYEKLYKEFEDEINEESSKLQKFSKYVPRGIETITSIEIYNATLEERWKKK